MKIEITEDEVELIDAALAMFADIEAEERDNPDAKLAEELREKLAQQKETP